MAERYDFYVHDNRKITFNLTEPIMREDSGVTDFVFHIPKILNELEVSDWQWWLVFVNAKKEKYSIALTLSDDPERPLEYNFATYTVDYAMSIKAGSVQFALEAINAGTGGAIDNEWHTLTYEIKVKETLQGNQAEYAETESDIISALLEEVRTKVNQLVGGATPEVKNSKAEMTEHQKIYVLSTDSNWYYWDGSDWQSGGVYGAGVVDTVPTQGSTNAVSSGGVYSALAGKVAKPLTSPNGTNGQLLRTLGNGQTEWTDFATPTSEQVGEAVENWLDDHPEATTTVQDWSLTADKFVLGANGYVTPEQYGAKGDGLTDDTIAIQSAIASGFPVKFENGKTYIVTEITIYHGIVIDGNGATLKRPNLKLSPYNYTDSEIKWSVMIKFGGENTSDKTTIIKNLNFDANCWEMWQESDGYKYEHGQCIHTGTGTSAHPTRLIIDNCSFKDSYSSAVSCVSYTELTFSNCQSLHCFKGIVTFVGQGSKLDMVNVKCFNPTYDFHTINIEINGNDLALLDQSNVNLTNIYVEKELKLGVMSGSGTLNATNLICKDMQNFNIYSSGAINISNASFELADTAGTYWFLTSKKAQAYNIVLSNVSFRGISDAYPWLSYRNQSGQSEEARIIFDNCIFEHMNSACTVQTRNSNIEKSSIIFKTCIFKEITNAIIRAEESKWYVHHVDFIECTIDIDANAYILDLHSNYKTPIFTFDNNRFLSDNAGIYLYGDVQESTLIFKDDFWENGLAVKYYRSTTPNPTVFGHRYRIVENVPTGKGYNDCDIAIVTSESNAKYIYTNNAWTTLT